MIWLVNHYRARGYSIRMAVRLAGNRIRESSK